MGIIIHVHVSLYNNINVPFIFKCFPSQEHSDNLLRKYGFRTRKSPNCQNEFLLSLNESFTKFCTKVCKHAAFYTEQCMTPPQGALHCECIMAVHIQYEFVYLLQAELPPADNTFVQISTPKGKKRRRISSDMAASITRLSIIPNLEKSFVIGDEEDFEVCIAEECKRCSLANLL